MLKRFLLLSACFAVTAFAQKDEDVKADSVVYEKPKEWRIYSAGAPVVAFTLTKDLIWYATSDVVMSSSLKKVAVQKYPTLGKIPASGVTCMITCAKGNAWMGGKNGIAVRVGTQFINYTTENGLPDNSITALATGGDGRVWAGTENGAAVFQNGTWTAFTTKEGLVSNKVQCLTIDNKGAVWIGTDKGISIYDGAKWTTQNMKKGMSWNDVKALACDTKKGTIWAAVGEKDVNCLDKGSWSTYMEIQPGITSIMIDSQSRIWFGSTSGLLKFNGDEWITDPKAVGIPAAQVSCMVRDEGGNLWFAMESGVLRLSNPYPY